MWTNESKYERVPCCESELMPPKISEIQNESEMQKISSDENESSDERIPKTLSEAQKRKVSISRNESSSVSTSDNENEVNS